MANLEQIMAETSKSYDNSRKALNDQINAISGDLEAQKQRIDAQYAQQAKQLDRQRNQAASAASMSAARTGGSFGGSAAIANDRYYQQAYVPAVTQMQTNRANDFSSAESQANKNRLSLQQTLAQLNDEADRYALQRYDAAVQAERDEAYRQAQLALQRQQLAAEQAKYAKNGWGRAQQDDYGTTFFGNNGSVVTMGTYLKNNGVAGNNANILAYAKNYLSDDELAQLNRIVNAQANTKHANLAYTTSNAYQNKKYLSDADNALLRRLGVTF